VYVPKPNALTDEAEIRAFVRDVGTADVVTVGPDGYPLSTLLPIVWDGDRVIAHFARANAHWQQITSGAPVLLVVRGPQAYVSPTWYAAKKEHGRVVPTWNYSAVQLRGRATISRDPDWLREAVTLLTNAHEGERDEPWGLTDAPPDYIDGMLKAIVGVEILVETVEGKAKLSQNRSVEDREGVVNALRLGGNARGEHQVAEQMARSLSH
jgi:transcriptional regulator